MADLKTCLFCGRNVDRSFDYCPHCGYEFGQGEDIPALLEDTPEEACPQADQDYLGRIRTLQEILSDMERELDRILKSASRGP